MNKKICFFGSYDPQYPRNSLTRKAFIKLGWETVDCNDCLPGVGHYLKLISKFIKHGRKTNLIFVGVLGHYDVPLAWFFAKIFRKELIFDAFLSLYDTYIKDRKVAEPKSYKALRFYFYDWISIRLADKVILDTKENIDYFIKKYKAKRNKFFELPVTADPEIFKYYSRKRNRIFTVGFYGSFMPLHGVDVIVKALEHLKDSNIKCLLFGIGPGIDDTKKLIERLGLGGKVILTNQKVEYWQLPSYFEKIDLFLGGPFGSSDKAKRVVPAKIAESLCTGVPTIVTRTPTTNRLLRNLKGIIWLDQVLPENLARKVEEAKKFNVKKSIEIRNGFSKSQLSFEGFKNRLIGILNIP